MITPTITKLKDGVTVYFLKDTKFKTASLKISFLRPLTKDEVTLNSLIPAIIRRGSKKYPSTKELNVYLDMLYGAEFLAGIRKKGENQLITFSYKTVSDKYAKDEKPFEKLISLMEETIFNPLTDNGSFNKEFVEREKENLKQTLRSIVNDKREYAKKRLIEEMYKDVPYGIFEYGYEEDLKAINEQNLYQHYLKVLTQSEIKIFVTGDFEESKLIDILTKIFENRNTQNSEIVPFKKDSLKKEPVVIEETDNVTQGKLCMGFKTNISTADELYFPMMIANNLFGGSVHSKLFTVVREKMSLAYYAGSSYSAFKGLILVNCGIEFDKYETTVNEVYNQLNELKKGNFTDEELKFSILAITSSYKSSTDSMAALEDFYIAQTIVDKPHTLKESILNIENVTREAVIEAANKIVPDTVFFLKGSEK